MSADASLQAFVQAALPAIHRRAEEVGANVADAVYEALNVRIEPVPALDGDELEQVAARIARHPINLRAPLVPEVDAPPGRPLYVVHAGDGEVGWFLRELSPAGRERPIVGVLASGWLDEPMPGDVPEMAARYLRHIREHQPRGPYTIGGYCTGAVVAVELCRQLLAAGECVDRVFLIDPSLEGGSWTLHDLAFFRLNQVRKRRHPVMEPYYELAQRLTVDGVLRSLQDETAAGDDPIEHRFLAGLRVLWNVTATKMAYQLESVPVPATMYLTAGLLQATNGRVEPFRRTWGRAVRGSLDVRRFDCMHPLLFGHRPFREALHADLDRG